MNKDMIEGAEMLEKRVRAKIQWMPYQQAIDDGGLLGIMHSEFIKMLDEWSNQTIKEYKAMK